MINPVFNTVTHGCMTVGTASQFNGELNVLAVNAADIHAEGAFVPPSVEAYPKKSDTTVVIGLVCGVDIGMNVLYALDDALITIDGKYLIVQKERQ